MHDAMLAGSRNSQAPGPKGKTTLKRREFSSFSKMRGRKGENVLFKYFLVERSKKRGFTLQNFDFFY